MWPATMTSTMPIARIRMYPFCTMRFEMFCGRSRIPFVKISKRMITAINARKIPFLPRSEMMYRSDELGATVATDSVTSGFLSVSVIEITPCTCQQPRG
jgi:hypothetical protein